MAAITEDYVSFETAKLLKEKGFDEKCLMAYIDGELFNYYDSDFPSEYELENDGSEVIDAPTLQIAMKWLREVHNIHIDICSIYDVANWLYQVFVITPRTARNSYVDKILYTSYEQAVKAGIKYCLENLI